MRHVLVTGFGPFLSITDNPSGRLALAVDGLLLGPDIRVVAKVLAVNYETAVAQTLLSAAQINAIAILGIGVASGTANARVERTAFSLADGTTPDAAGQVRSLLGPEPSRTTAAAEPLARALGIPVSDDAGRYVCNAWLYGVLGGTQVPATFLHVPDAGGDPEWLRAGLARWVIG